MSFTKGELVHSALDELGIADYDFDVIPEQLQSGIRKLDAMIMNWNGRGIILSYPISGTPNTPDPDSDSNIPDVAWEAVVTNLAIRIAPSYGKTVSPDTKITAKNAMNTLIAKYAQTPEMQLPSMPKGAAYKNIDDRRWTRDPESEILLPVDETIDPSGGPV